MPTYGPGESLVWSGATNYNEEYSGTLYLTNRRLLFEYKKGMVGKGSYVAVETPLSEITNVSIETGPWNWNVLVIATGDKRLRFMFRSERPGLLASRISELMAGQSRR